MRLDVYMGGRKAGILEQPSPQEYRFTYHKDALPISLTMPVREVPYRSPYLHPIFQVSLPEGDLRALIESGLLKRVSTSGDLAILALVGAHLVGAVSVVPEGEPLPAAWDLPDVTRILHYGQAPDALLDLVRRHAAQAGVSGSYPKILAQQSALAGTLAVGGWIVKIPAAGRPDIAINEHYSLAAARYAGIETAESHLSEDGQILMVRRFDRHGGPSEGRPLAFEDMASLLGLPASRKFSGSVERIIKTIGIVCAGAARKEALTAFFRQYALAMVMRNGDAHLKNFGVLYTPGARDVRLAPCYDMVTMTAYAPMNPDGSTRDIPALTWAGKKRWPARRDLEAVGVACGLSPAHIGEVLDATVAGLTRAARDLHAYTAQHPACAPTTQKILALWRCGVAQSGYHDVVWEDAPDAHRPVRRAGASVSHSPQ